MNIRHHLDHATILAYAAATLGEALTIVAASHIARCPACRAAVRQAETMGGQLMLDLNATAVSSECKMRTLGLLDRATLHRFPARTSAQDEVPVPLSRALGCVGLRDLPWKRKAPGVALHHVPLSSPDGGKLVLMRIAPGRAMPEHGHGGEELTLVLRGAYHDEMGRFGPGDVADLDEEVEHRPVVEAGEDCYCAVAIEAPTRFKSLSARLIQPFIGI
ncbi:MAG: ChrR family anti-sigma-E factor [Alphaproteobacteria bacterium]|nr:ChrR family anti-sigma-E factor [Alphaproteobacteria bacterium]